MKNNYFAKKPVIAVLDDDIDDQLIIKEAFSSNPFPVTIVCFTRPIELENYLAENAESHQLPHLILLDLYNDGRTTFDCISHIKTSPSFGFIPIVMMSGSSIQSQVQQFYRLGGASFILKPLDFEEWQHTLSVLCQYWFDIVLLSHNR